MKLKFLWITDPWDTLDHPKDTTLRWIEESLILGKVESYWTDVKSIRWESGQVVVDACLVKKIFPGRAEKSFEMGEPQALAPKTFHQLFYRTDPPVDLAYLHPLQLLALGLDGAKNSHMVNPFSVLFSGNEKMEASLLESWMPTSFVGSRWYDLEAFGKNEGRTVLKPLFQAQSLGIELLDWTSPDGIENAKTKLAEATDQFQRPVLLQRFLPGIAQGEQRLWFLDGKLLACARKRPRTGEFKIDMDRGGTLVQTELNENEKKAASQIGKFLKKRRIRLAAVDLIDGFVTDFNFTSPGLIVQMEGLLGQNLSRTIIQTLSETLS